MTFNELVVALVAIIGGLSGAVGVLFRALMVAKDRQITRLELEVTYWRRRAEAKPALDRLRRHGDAEPGNGHEEEP